MLANWVKAEEPFLPYPPADMQLVGWRDPFIFEFMTKAGQHKEWGMLMGSGIKGKGGAVMIYRSDTLRSGMLAALSHCECKELHAFPLLDYLVPFDDAELSSIERTLLADTVSIL